MRFTESAIEEIAGRLVQLGLSTCQVCGSASTLGADKRPVVLPIGGASWNPKGGPALVDPDANVLFMLRVECEACGNSLLFNSEKFFSGDTPIFKT